MKKCLFLIAFLACGTALAAADRVMCVLDNGAEIGWQDVAARLGYRLGRVDSVPGATFVKDGLRQISFLDHVDVARACDLVVVCGGTADAQAKIPLGARHVWSNWKSPDLATFRPACNKLVHDLHAVNPEARLVFVMPDGLNDDYRMAIRIACGIWEAGDTSVDLKGIAKEKVVDCICGTIAPGMDAPGAFAKFQPARYGGAWYPGESAVWRFRFDRVGAGEGLRFGWRVVDSHGREFGRGALDGKLLDGREHAFTLTEEMIGGRLGTLGLEFTAASPNREVKATNGFTRLQSGKVRPVLWIGTGASTCEEGGMDDGWWAGDFRDADLVEAAGIGMVRTGLWWPRYEQKPREYVPFDGYENWWRDLGRRGIAMSCILAGQNPIYRDRIDPAAFRDFCEWIARRWAGVVDYWEFFNESANFNWPEVYGNREEDWYPHWFKTQRMASEGILKGNPAATFETLVEDTEYRLDKMIKDGAVRDWEAISFHPYCHMQPRPEREYFFKDGGRFYKDLALRHGGCKRWFVTEAGWTTVKGDVAYFERVGSYPKVNAAQQARFLIRMYLLARTYGCVSAMQFSFRNRGRRREYTEHNFGMVNEDGSPKAAYGATAFLARMLGEAEVGGEISPAPGLSRVCRFRKGEKTVLAAWWIEGEGEYELPADLEAPECAYDLQGNRIALHEVVNGRMLKLTEEPVYFQMEGKR